MPESISSFKTIGSGQSKQMPEEIAYPVLPDRDDTSSIGEYTVVARSEPSGMVPCNSRGTCSQFRGKTSDQLINPRHHVFAECGVCR